MLESIAKRKNWRALQTTCGLQCPPMLVLCTAQIALTARTT
jgi:hypothetical protein